MRVQAVQILNGDGEPCRAFEYNDTVVVEVTVRSHIDVSDLSLSFLVRDMTGVDLMGTTTFDERVPLPPLGKDGILTVRFSFTNTLRPGNFGVSVAVNRVSRRDYTDSLLFDQIDGGAAFTVLAHPERPVHYKFHQPVVIRYERVSGGIRADVVEVQQAAGRRRPSA